MSREDIVRGLLDKAVAIAGSEAALGKACKRPEDERGYSQHAIWHARKIGHVSPKMALRIEYATKGAIRAGKLCPALQEWLLNSAQPNAHG